MRDLCANSDDQNNEIAMSVGNKKVLSLSKVMPYSNTKKNVVRKPARKTKSTFTLLNRDPEKSDANHI